MITEIERQELIEKHQKLIAIKEQLKSEFVGINQIIEALMEAMSSWYLFPEMQDKPVVINLWGLTGVGKSSLIKRLVELLEFDKKFLHFNLNDSDWSLRSTLDSCCDYLSSSPMILALDEFQHARTIDQDGKELKWTSSGIIWEILDKGKLQISTTNTYELDELSKLISKLKYLVENGVTVSKGKVITKKSFFVQELEPKSKFDRDCFFSSNEDSTDKEVFFVPFAYHESFSELISPTYRTRGQFSQKLAELNEQETIDFLSSIYESSSRSKIIDCSKGLIFILGNLDEAYSMCADFNPDIDADEFHEDSLKINLPIIKESLKKRFRSEHIARLGNIHLIYPAFSKESFYHLIDLELQKISQNVWAKQQIKILFDSSIRELIYQEGVFPTQGTRPLFTTIHQIVNAKLGQIFTEMILNNFDNNEIELSVKKSSIIVDYKLGNQVLHSLSIEHQSSVQNLREATCDYKQAVVAVHESGHAIISSILLKTVPEVVFSITAEVNSNGFVYTKLASDIISRKDILNRLSCLLAGFVAEKIVFGEDSVTTGAESDIEKATSFVCKLLKKSGFGSIPAAYHEKDYHSRNYLYDPDDKITKQAEAWICSALELTEKTLREQEVLLIKIADYLSDHPHIKKPQIIEMINRYSVNIDIAKLTEKSDLEFYRDHLKLKVSELQIEFN